MNMRRFSTIKTDKEYAIRAGDSLNSWHRSCLHWVSKDRVILSSDTDKVNLHVILGSLILSVLNSMLTFLSVGQAIQQVVYGSIVLLLA